MEIMTIIWLALLIVFLILEAATVQLMSIWFAASLLFAILHGIGPVAFPE